jgi:hypothetical protein
MTKGKTMTVVINDKRRVTPESPSVTDPLAQIASTDPEKTFQVVVGAMKEYVRRRSRVEKDKGGKEWTRGVMIPGPDHEVVEEFGRYVTEALLKSQDARAWRLMPVSEMLPGDVFTRYTIVKGKPQDEEVTVVTCRDGKRPGIRIVKFRCPTGYDELKASPDYLYYVYRPTTADLLSELEEA